MGDGRTPRHLACLSEETAQGEKTTPCSDELLVEGEKKTTPLLESDNGLVVVGGTGPRMV